jgi:hypothetical protein
MTAHFVDRPLIEVIDSIIGTDWREIWRPLPRVRQPARIILPFNSPEYLASMGLDRVTPIAPAHDPNREAIVRASGLFDATGLFRAFKAGMYEAEVTPVGAQGLSDPTLPRIFLPVTFWVSAPFVILRDPPLVCERITPKEWRRFANPVVRWPAVAAEPVPPPAQSEEDEGTPRERMEKAFGALLADQTFSTQKAALDAVLARLGIKGNPYGYGRMAFRRVWGNVKKRRP